MANVFGFAAISLPTATNWHGCPSGVQLMAPEETVLLQLAAQLERPGICACSHSVGSSSSLHPAL